MKRIWLALLVVNCVTMFVSFVEFSWRHFRNWSGLTSIATSQIWYGPFQFLNGQPTSQQIQSGGTIDLRLVKDRFVACPIA
jgi:hypothetical protein